MERGEKYKAVMEYLLAGNPLTSNQSLFRFGLSRLAPLVHRLRTKGHDIRTKMIDSPSGNYAEYQLKKRK